MGGFTFGAWASLGSANATIAAAGSTVFGTVDNAGKTATQVSVSVSYHVSATSGVALQIERDVDGATFEGESSAPWVVQLPFAAGTTREMVLTVPADLVGKFRVRAVNLDAAQAASAVNVRVSQGTFA